MAWKYVSNDYGKHWWQCSHCGNCTMMLEHVEPTKCATPLCHERHGAKDAQTGQEWELPDTSTQAERESGKGGLQEQISNWLDTHGYESLHISPRGREKKGWPDNVFAIRGQAVAIEAKAKGRKPTDVQDVCHRNLRANGWTVRVVHSLDEVIALVRAMEMTP